MRDDDPVRVTEMDSAPIFATRDEPGPPWVPRDQPPLTADELAEAAAFDHAFLHGLGDGYPLPPGSLPVITVVDSDALSTPIDPEKIAEMLLGFNYPLGGEATDA